MYRSRKSLIFSPHDLVTFLGGDFASWMDRLYCEYHAGQLGPEALKSVGLTEAQLVPDKDDEQAEVVQRKGYEHEAHFLEQLEAKKPDMAKIERSDRALEDTLAAMKAGRDTIYQACLSSNGFTGYPDFLVRVPVSSKLGEFSYEPWDTKLAKSAKPYFIVQLCTYAEMLEAMQGHRPEKFTFVLGNKTQQTFHTDGFFYYYHHLRKAFCDFQKAFDATKPLQPTSTTTAGRWSEVASHLLEQSDHLSRVARITRSQVKQLEAAGITTLTDLAKAGRSVVRKMAPDTFTRLQQQAAAQVKSRGKATPYVKVITPLPEAPRRGLALLPPPSKLDVFFDMEGFPLAEGGLEYLFGAVHTVGRSSQFRDWWAHDAVQEQAAFEQFVDWAHAQWKADPSMHIYHYAAYENTALRRLMGKYASRETEVDNLLRNEVFVDLYTVVRQGLIIGTPGYSLKDIECLYMGKREGEVVTAGGSVAAYQRWLDSDEPQDWQHSKILDQIRSYNCLDCTSLLGLRDWLLGLQKEHGIAYLSRVDAEPEDTEASTPESEASILARRLLEPSRTKKAEDPETRRVRELLAWLLEFHWREAKPIWWRFFDRQEKTEEELRDDFDCLAGLQRTRTPPQSDKQSMLYEYRFDPDQDTKLHEGSKCYFSSPDLFAKTIIHAFDADRGTVVIKLGPSSGGEEPSSRLSLIPDEIVSAKTIAAAVYRYSAAWADGSCPSRAVDDLLHRHPPRILAHKGGPLVKGAEDHLPQVVKLIEGLDRSTLCIQGPPGTGKTYTCGQVIAHLLKKGKKVGVTASSHKAILNIMHAVLDAMEQHGVQADLYKAGETCEDPRVLDGSITSVIPAKASAVMGDGPVVIGGTAWLFSRPELEQSLDYLFIDEAGQFSLANAVAVGLSTANLVLVGDQMQLSQPIQGAHPGESGQSALDYLLNGQATIPDDFGVFLGTTRRLHPDICRFISEAVYEGRLTPHPLTSQRRVVLGKGCTVVDRPVGIQFVPVQHDGNTQCSDEEVEVIRRLVDELLGCRLRDEGDKTRPLKLDDVLFVAPYNMQVRRLQQALGKSAKVGSVDKFQGQEAPVVIVSMCASSLEDCPRGAEFLLDTNRLNVAISRAQCLALVVGNPGIMATRCGTIEQMKLVNLFCRLVDYCGARGQ